MGKKKVNIYDEMKVVKKDIAHAKEKEQHERIFSLYKEYTELRKKEAILKYADPVALREEIEHHEHTQHELQKQFGAFSIQQLFEASQYNSRVMHLFTDEQKHIFELQKKLKALSEYTLGENTE